MAAVGQSASVRKDVKSYSCFGGPEVMMKFDCIRGIVISNDHFFFSYFSFRIFSDSEVQIIIK